MSQNPLLSNSVSHVSLITSCTAVRLPKQAGRSEGKRQEMFFFPPTRGRSLLAGQRSPSSAGGVPRCTGFTRPSLASRPRDASPCRRPPRTHTRGSAPVLKEKKKKKRIIVLVCCPCFVSAKRSRPLERAHPCPSRRAPAAASASPTRLLLWAMLCPKEAIS